MMARRGIMLDKEVSTGPLCHTWWKPHSIALAADWMAKEECVQGQGI